MSAKSKGVERSEVIRTFQELSFEVSQVLQFLGSGQALLKKFPSDRFHFFVDQSKEYDPIGIAEV
jgi:hypothetical protein